MRALIQRVAHAQVDVDGKTIGKIGRGLLVFLGVEKEDNEISVAKLAKKLCNYRVFSDSDGKMNLNVTQVGGEILLVSQFTLVAETDRGNRPSFSKGASPAHGEAMYELMKTSLKGHGISLQTGCFGADMKVSLLNDGPVTFNLSV